MVTIKCDMCGKYILNDDRRISISFPKEDCFVCYDICEECSNKIDEFIKESHKQYCEPIIPEEQETFDKCNKEYCNGCESFNYTSSVLEPNKLHIRCNKTNQFRVVDLEHKVKPKDFYEEEK